MALSFSQGAAPSNIATSVYSIRELRTRRDQRRPRPFRAQWPGLRRNTRSRGSRSGALSRTRRQRGNRASDTALASSCGCGCLRVRARIFRTCSYVPRSLCGYGEISRFCANCSSNVWCLYRAGKNHGTMAMVGMGTTRRRISIRVYGHV